MSNETITLVRFPAAPLSELSGMLLPQLYVQGVYLAEQGIGIGTTGAAAFSLAKRYADSSGRHLTMGEGDWIGILSSLACRWLDFRGVTFRVCALARVDKFRAARSGDLMALLLASFAALAIFQGQITMHTAYAHLAWFAAGLTMAAARAAWAPGAARVGRNRMMPPRRVRQLASVC